MKKIFAARFLLTFNDSFTIFSIASVDINKIMVVFYHLLVCPWISVEKIILTLTNCFISFFSSEIQDGCRGHMTTPFTKKFKKVFFT
jgi:hypothetical protein